MASHCSDTEQPRPLGISNTHIGGSIVQDVHNMEADIVTAALERILTQKWPLEAQTPDVQEHKKIQTRTTFQDHLY